MSTLYSNSDNVHFSEQNYLNLVNDFLKSYSSKKNKHDILTILRIFYNEIRTNSKIYSEKNLTLHLKKLKLADVMNIQTKIELEIENKNITKTKGEKYLYYLSKFLKFLSNKNIVNIYYRPPISKNYIRNKSIKYPVLLDFNHYLVQKN